MEEVRDDDVADPQAGPGEARAAVAHLRVGGDQVDAEHSFHGDAPFVASQYSAPQVRWGVAAWRRPGQCFTSAAVDDHAADDGSLHIDAEDVGAGRGEEVAGEDGEVAELADFERA